MKEILCLEFNEIAGVSCLRLRYHTGKHEWDEGIYWLEW